MEYFQFEKKERKKRKETLFIEFDLVVLEQCAYDAYLIFEISSSPFICCSLIVAWYFLPNDFHAKRQVIGDKFFLSSSCSSSLQSYHFFFFIRNFTFNTIRSNSNTIHCPSFVFYHRLSSSYQQQKIKRHMIHLHVTFLFSFNCT